MNIYKQCRKYSGKTIREAANFLGITIGHLSDIEHDRKKPTPDILEKMERLYCASPNVLTDAEDCDKQEVMEMMIPRKEKGINGRI